jgi:serine/threonine protein kinase
MSFIIIVRSQHRPDRQAVNVAVLDRTVRLLGQGTFGKVVEAIDTKSNTRVAIKIIRAIPKYRDASKTEVRVLEKLKRCDPLNRQCVIFWFLPTHPDDVLQ